MFQSRIEFRTGGRFPEIEYAAKEAQVLKLSAGGDLPWRMSASQPGRKLG